MNMKQKNCIMACHALDRLMAQETSIRTAKKIFDMREKLQSAWDFQVSEEKKIYASHPNVNPMDGTVTYSENDEIQKKQRLDELTSFEEKFNELFDMEQDIEIEPFTISQEEQKNIKITGNDIKALMGFITFE